jgi:hypothetical protein
MKNKISLTDRDREILLALLHKVPVLSESALAVWWPDTDDPVTSAEFPPASAELAATAPNSPGALPS